MAQMPPTLLHFLSGFRFGPLSLQLMMLRWMSCRTTMMYGCARLEELAEGNHSFFFLPERLPGLFREDGPLCFERVGLPVHAPVSICMASLGGRVGTTLSGAG